MPLKVAVVVDGIIEPIAFAALIAPTEAKGATPRAHEIVM